MDCRESIHSYRVSEALGHDSAHHLGDGKRAVAGLPQELHVVVAQEALNGVALLLREEAAGRPLGVFGALQMLQEERREHGHQGEVVVAVQTSEESVAEAGQLARHVHELAPQLAAFPEAVVGAVGAEHEQEGEGAGGEGVRHRRHARAALRDG